GGPDRFFAFRRTLRRAFASCRAIPRMNTPTLPLRRASALPCALLLIAAHLGLFQAAADAQQPGAPRAYHPGGLVPPPTKELIYVVLPGTLEGSWDQTGNGIVVLDASNHYNFIKRIPTWNV